MENSDRLFKEAGIARFFKRFLDLIYPHLCFNCKQKLTENSLLCQNCKNKLALTEENSCIICKKEFDADGICNDCKEQFPFDEFVSVFDFNAITQNMIHNFKYKENKKIGRYLSNFLSKKLERFEFISMIDYIVPVPLHKVKRRERGFNQAYIIAKNIHKNLQIPLARDMVERQHFTKTQTNLSKSERRENVAQAFTTGEKDLIRNKNFC